MEKTIDRFIDEEFFLSNFYPCPIIYNGKEYKSVEHGYQASKADNEPEHEWVRNMDSPGKARKNGQFVHMRKDWESVKENIMSDLVRIKFFSNPELAEKLLDTKYYDLVESNFWHDNFFGNCTCIKCRNIEGQNKLGIILMRVRDELIEREK